MIKRVFILSASLSVAFFSCALLQEKAKLPPTKVIKISGCESCYPLIEALTTEYIKSHPEIKIRFLPESHCKGGIEGVAQGLLDIGLVSRELKPEEKARGLTYLLLANDGLVIATHRSIKIQNFTTQQIKAIYSGKIKNWKELGGPDAPIIVLDRPENESAKIIFRRYVLGRKLLVIEKAPLFYYESDIAKALQKIPFAIGYLSLDYALSKKLPTNLAHLDGVAPSVNNILKGDYKITIPQGIVYKKLDFQTQKLLDFFLSPEAKEIMIKAGFTPYQKK